MEHNRAILEVRKFHCFIEYIRPLWLIFILGTTGQNYLSHKPKQSITSFQVFFAVNLWSIGHLHIVVWLSIFYYSRYHTFSRTMLQYRIDTLLLSLNIYESYLQCVYKPVIYPFRMNSMCNNSYKYTHYKYLIRNGLGIRHWEIHSKTGYQVRCSFHR